MYSFKERKTRILVECLLLASVSLPFAGGCRSNTVITATGTTIGVELAENPATHVPHAKLGYNRAEVAFVPTNRPGVCEDPATRGITRGEETTRESGIITGSDVTAEVIMELKYAGIFSWGASGGIYQRLAVGKTAVQQPGAAYMFARDVSGVLDPETARNVTAALTEIPTAGPREVEVEVLRKAFIALQSTKKAVFDKAAQEAGFPDFQGFLTAPSSEKSPEKIEKIVAELKKDDEVRAELERLSKE